MVRRERVNRPFGGEAWNPTTEYTESKEEEGSERREAGRG
jgi:hypothetical protein